jgi:hypothetical protein
MIVLGEAHLRWILSDYGRNWIERTTYNLKPELHRRPEPESANQSAKTKWRRRPAAAAPPRRLEQVALRQSSLESARASLARARGGSDSG